MDTRCVFCDIVPWQVAQALIEDVTFSAGNGLTKFYGAIWYPWSIAISYLEILYIISNISELIWWGHTKFYFISFKVINTV